MVTVDFRLDDFASVFETSSRSTVQKQVHWLVAELNVRVSFVLCRSLRSHDKPWTNQSSRSGRSPFRPWHFVKFESFGPAAAWDSFSCAFQARNPRFVHAFVLLIRDSLLISSLFSFIIEFEGSKPNPCVLS